MVFPSNPQQVEEYDLAGEALSEGITVAGCAPEHVGYLRRVQAHL